MEGLVMKKAFSFIPALAIAAFALSCEKANQPAPQIGPASFTATAPATDDVTRTSVSGSNVLWNNGESISVFDGGTESAGAAYTTTLGSPSATATFSGSGAVEVGGKYYAFSPASAVTSWNKGNDGLLRYTVPTTQIAVKNDFSNGGAFLMGSGTGSELAFRHVAAYIKLYFGDASPTDIVSVQVSEGNGARAAGGFTIDYAAEGAPSNVSGSTDIVLKNSDDSPFEKGYYYVAVRPRTWKGLTLSFKNTANKISEVKWTDDIDLAVGHIQYVGEVKNLSYGAVAVGDIYKEGGVNKGIVVAVSASDYSVMSLDGTAKVWSPSAPPAAITSRTDGAANTATITGWATYSETQFPAAYYCASRGGGWYLPGSTEMRGYMTNVMPDDASYNAFNAKITGAGGDSIAASRSAVRFWSSDTDGGHTKVYYAYVNSSNDITAGSGVATSARHTRCIKKVSL